MKHLALASLTLALCAPALAGCPSEPAVKGTIPPGTPPPEYEPARAYTPGAPSAAPAETTPAAPAAPAPAPDAPAPAPSTAPQG